MPAIDLNIPAKRLHYVVSFQSSQQEYTYVHRQTRFLASPRFSSYAHVSPMRETLQWRSQGQEFFLPGPVPQHGLRTTDLSGKLTRHRSLPTSAGQQTLPHGNPQPGVKKHSVQCQQGQRLANLRRQIKQNLRIKAFYGTSENAVKTQIWIAVTVYLMIAILKKRLKIEASLYTILQILSVTAFERTPIKQLLTNPVYSYEQANIDNQLKLFS